jgi:hypothetical protein
VNATPVRPTVFAAGFMMVNVNVEFPPGITTPGLNTLPIEGGATTARLAEAVPPAPPSLETTALVVLFCAPAVMPVTFTVKLQEALAASPDPASVMLPDPSAAVIAPPPQAPVRPFGAEITKPAGSASVKPTPVSDAAALGFDTVNVSELPPFNGTLAAPNAFSSVGGAMTVVVALEVFPVPAFVEVTVTLLFFTPAAVPVTLTENVQALFAASVAPKRLTAPEPDEDVIVPPPHNPVSPFGVATTKPAGKLSVKATPVSATVFTAGLVIVKLKDVEPFSGMLDAPNDFAITGALATVRLAEAVLPVPPLVELTVPVVLVN